MNFNAALKKRHADTGLWLLKIQQFQDWKAALGSFFWLYGIPGCGTFFVIPEYLLMHL